MRATPCESLLLDFRGSIEKQPRGKGHELTGYVDKLLSAFAQPKDILQSNLIEPLSQRELEVLRLIAQGLSNREISKRLFLALNTVKGHNRDDLWQTTSPKPHRSHSSRPRIGSVVARTSVCPQTWSQELRIPKGGFSQRSLKPAVLELLPSQYSNNNTPKQHLSVYPLIPPCR